MNRHIAEMGNILKQETAIFEKIYALEEKKTGAIIDHNGKLIEKISMEQEGLLGKVSDLETERMKKVDAYKRERHIRKEITTLSDITAMLGQPSGGMVASLGGELKDIMGKLACMQDTNRVLITDNMKYYNILLTGLRRDTNMDAGYRHDGKEEEKLRNSILFNTTV
ncbi:MAG: flagellar protein FlgN [Spirochaetes bacterium]|nr:flagellar protein FlgN [Spirochaetota bacterium]